MSTYETPVGAIQYMSLARPTKKGQYTIKLQFDGNTEEGAQLRNILKELDPLKIIMATKDGKLVGPTSKHYNVIFSSNYVPRLILDAQGNELTGDEIPFFDSRTDSGRAAVTFYVNTKEGKNYINLKNVILGNLDLVPKADQTEIINQVKQRLTEKMNAALNG